MKFKTPHILFSNSFIGFLHVLILSLAPYNIVNGQVCSNTCPPLNFGKPVPSLCEGDILSNTDKVYQTCHPTPTKQFKFSDYLRPGQVVVVSNFYIGCNAGRRESGVFAHVAQKYYNMYGNRTMFITSLKGGTSCERWAQMYQRDATRLFPNPPEEQQQSVTPVEMPLTVYDQEYELRDELFTTPFGHPSYVILDGTLTVRHKFIGPCCGYESYFDCTANIAKELDTTLSTYIDAILAEESGATSTGTSTSDNNNPSNPINPGTNINGCDVGDFSDWSACSVFCGLGIQFRWRRVASHSGSDRNTCPEPVETRVCNAGARCPQPQANGCIEEFGETWEIQTLASGFDGPRDVAFHPTPGLHLGDYSEGRSFNPNLGGEEAWVVNGNNHSVSIIEALGTPKQTTISRRDRGYYHYMVNATALSFNMVSNSNRSPDRDGFNYWAVCNDNLNTYAGFKEANNFMGPTLYNSDPNGRNVVNRLGEQCNRDEPCYFLHSDMLHESPGCIGIVHDPETTTAYGNVYWAFDATGNGQTGQLVRFDFQQPHGPGSMDHSVAAVRRYPEVELTRGELGVHAGMAAHPTRRELFIAVPGGNKILVVNMDSGKYARTARQEYPIFSSRLPSFEYSIWECVEQQVFAKSIDTPTGLAISPNGDKLFVAERSTGKIHVYEIESRTLLYNIETGFETIGGMAFSPQTQRLHFVDDKTNTLNAVNVEKACATPIPSQTPPAFTKEANLARSVLQENGLASFSFFRNYTCAVDPVVPDAAFFDQVHLDTGYASDDPNVQSSVAGMDASAALLANRTDCGPESELNFDALLLGGYYCHQCLPHGNGAECDPGGTCTNIQWLGYTCDNEFVITRNGWGLALQTADRTVISSFGVTKPTVVRRGITYRFTVRSNTLFACLYTTAIGASKPYALPDNDSGCATNGPLMLTITSDMPRKLYLHVKLRRDLISIGVFRLDVEGDPEENVMEDFGAFLQKKNPNLVNPKNSLRLTTQGGSYVSSLNSNGNRNRNRNLKGGRRE